MICRTTAPLVALGLVLVASSQALGAECSADRATFSGRGRLVEVAVEIADNPAERARGLRNMVVMLCAAALVMLATLLARFWFRRYQRIDIRRSRCLVWCLQ